MILTPEESGLPKGTPLNPAQILVLDHKDEPKNLLISFNTGAGKTSALSMIAHKYLYGEDRKKLIYVAPMKALVEEKKRDWTDERHPYSKFNLQIITGDYVGTWEKDELLNNADIIVITPESLASRLRNMRANKSSFLKDTGLLCIDEIHLLDEGERGATLEAALLEFTAEYPEVPILGLSGTIPNASSIVGWLDKLNDLDTVLIVSDYRATKLHKMYYEYNGYDKGEERIKLLHALDKKYDGDQKIIGVFSKAFGRKIETSFKDDNKECEFHNADKAKDKRESIERKFRTGELDRLVATKTLAIGMNLPADHMFITAATAGGTDIKAYELNQFAGRAGRAGLREEGYAHFFLPHNNFYYHKKRIEQGEPILSQFANVQMLALHFLGAMYIGRISSYEDFYNWYSRTLVNHQSPMNAVKMRDLLDRIIKEMDDRGMIRDMAGTLKLRKRGEIAAQMGIDPYYLYDLTKNFSKFLAFERPSDVQLAEALGATTPYWKPLWANAPEQFKMPAEVRTGRVHDNYLSGVASHYLLVKGEHDIPDCFASMTWGIKQDIDRIGIVLDRLNFECENWKDDRVCLIPYRVYYGIGWKNAFLMHQGCSEAVARKLLTQGIEDVQELKQRPELAAQMLTPKQMKRLRINT